MKKVTAAPKFESLGSPVFLARRKGPVLGAPLMWLRINFWLLLARGDQELPFVGYVTIHPQLRLVTIWRCIREPELIASIVDGGAVMIHRLRFA